jgi:head-tail adaptor
VDEWGNAAQTWADHLTVQGSNQPLTVQEVGQLSQGGPVAASHRIFVPGTPDIAESDRIIDGARTFQVDGVADAAGAGHHLEILAHVVTDAV